MPTPEERERQTPEQIQLVAGGKTEPKLPFPNVERFDMAGENKHLDQLRGLFDIIEDVSRNQLEAIKQAEYQRGKKEAFDKINLIIGEFGDDPKLVLQIIDEHINGKKEVEL